MKKLVIFLVLFFCSKSNISQEKFNIGSFEYIIVDTYSATNFEVSIKKYNSCPKGTLTIPETIFYNSKTYKIIGIADDAFINCIDLTKVVFPKSIKYIGKSAFENTGLINIIYPKDLNNVGSDIFRDCKNLIKVSVEEGVTDLGNNTFSWCINLTDVTLPNSLINIGYSTFSACKSLKDVKLPNSIKSIGSGTFGGCTSLESVTVPKSLTNLTYNTFSGCTSLKNIILPVSIKNIESSTFSNCKSLESIIIPFNVESIGDYAFYNCTSLKSVILKTEIPVIINKLVFKDVDINNIPLTVPIGKKSIYQNTIIWRDFKLINESEIVNIEKKIKLFPNPAYDILNIQLENSILEKVNIYNLLGQLIKTEISSIVNVEEFNSGTYNLEIITNKGKFNKKIIIK